MDPEAVAAADRQRRADRTRRFLVALTGGMGVLHFVAPEGFDAIVPPALPGRARTYTEASGVAELAVAGLLAVPRTRRLGASAAIALFLAVFPANVQMAWDWRHESAARRAIAYGRLPLQAVLIAQAARVGRAAAEAREG